MSENCHANLSGIRSYVQISHDGRTRAVGLHNARGKKVITQDARGRVLLQDTHTNETTATLACGGVVENIVFSPDNQWLVAVCMCHYYNSIFHCKYTLQMWDLRNYEMVRCHTMYRDPPDRIAFSPDSQMLAFGLPSWFIQIWSVRFWHSNLRKWIPHCVINCENHQLDFEFTCDNRLVSCGPNSENPTVWHISGDTYNIQQQSINPQFAYHVACSPTDPSVLALSCGDGDLYITRNDVCAQLQGHTTHVRALAFSPCGQQLASGSYDGEVRLWDVATGACVRTLPMLKCIHNIKFLSNNKQIAVHSRNNTTLHVLTLCKWSERDHHLFNPDVRRRVVWVLCARARLAKAEQNMPYEIWRMIFQSMATTS